MKKKIVSILLLACILVGIVSMTGCQKGSASDFVIPEGGFNTEEQVTITFSHTMGSKLQGVLELYIEEFEKLYPNINVEHSYAGSWSEINGVINTQIFGGQQPNIAYCYPDHVALYNQAKAVVTLDSLIASDIATKRELTDAEIKAIMADETLSDEEKEAKIAAGTTDALGLTQAQKDDFVVSYYAEGAVFGDDLMYTMPLNKSTEVLYYDKTFFEANGLTVPTTWEELWAVCARIKELRPDDYPLGYDSEANWFITMCEQMNTPYTSATGENFLFDTAENRNFVKELREYYQKGYFTTSELYGTYTSNLFVNQDTTKARCYMCIGSSGGASYQMSNKGTTDGSFAFEVGVNPLPQLNADNKAAISQGPSLCILKGRDTSDQQILASWLFVKFLCTNVEFQAEFSIASGYMPVLKSVTENEDYAAWLASANGKENLIATVVKVGIDGRDTYYTSPAFVGSTAAREQVGLMLKDIISLPLAEGQSVDDLIAKEFADALAECKFQSGK